MRKEEQGTRNEERGTRNKERGMFETALISDEQDRLILLRNTILLGDGFGQKSS